MTDGSVYNNTTDGQYELQVDGMTAVAAYQREDSVVTFNHTGVPSELKGQGVGSRLIAGALDDVRRQGLRFVAVCPFVAAYIERHPEFQDLRAE